MKTSTLLASFLPLLSGIWEFLHSIPDNLGGTGILLLAFADSSFLSLPESNDALIVVLSAGNTWKNMIFYVGFTIAGSVLGCFLLYSIGRKGGSPVLHKRFSELSIARAERLFEQYGILTVLIPSILPPPCPFKIFVLSAGAFRLNQLKFAIAVGLGRTIRYASWGVLAVVYGIPVKLFVEQNLQKVGVVLLAVFAIIVMALAAVYIRSIRKRKDQSEAARLRTS